MVLCESCHSREAVPPLRTCNGCGVAQNGACTECGKARCSPYSTYCSECMKKRYD